MNDRSRLNLPQGSRRPPLATILLRVLWGGVWLVLFRPWPRRLGNGFRAMLLRIFGAKVGRGCLLCPTLRVMKPWQLRVGDYTAIGDNVTIYNFCEVSIGSMCVVSQDCYLCTGTHDYTDPTMPLISNPIQIETDAWVAAGVFIHPGVKIARGAVIGARSVVTKSMPEWSVCSGFPCRVIKPRLIKE